MAAGRAARTVTMLGACMLAVIEEMRLLVEWLKKQASEWIDESALS
jgi:hypothetical protein